jgi:hypothetical protein
MERDHSVGGGQTVSFIKKSYTCDQETLFKISDQFQLSWGPYKINV